MSSINKLGNALFTHEGAVAKQITPKQQLERTVMTCLLWEDSFYESGVSIAERIKTLVAEVKTSDVVDIAIKAKNEMGLRHVPLLLARELCRKEDARLLIADLLFELIQRADEIAEFLAIYFADGRQPLTKQVKKGLARAFGKFTEYQFAKYDNSRKKVKLRDALRLVHPKPSSEEQAILFGKINNSSLETPDTWEVAISAAGSDLEKKNQEWNRLLAEGKLPALALLRNLRNLISAGIETGLIRSAINNIDALKIKIPTYYIAAAREAIQFEPEIEAKFFETCNNLAKLKGETIIMVDVSGSMDDSLSSKSTMRRIDAACAVAMIARECCEQVRICTFANSLIEVPARKGFALRDAIMNQFGGGTKLGNALNQVYTVKHDRLIVITDEQTSDGVPDPINDKSYMINIATNKNGVGYYKWKHIDGWSPSVIDFIAKIEKR